LEPCDADASTSYIVPSSIFYTSFSQDVNQSVLVQLRDQYDNDLIWNGGYHLYATLDDNDGVIYRPRIIPNDNGQYKVDFTVPDAGDYILNVYLASGVRNSPDGLLGEYYSNRWLYGNPTMSRVDSIIDFQWGTGSITGTDYDYVSTRWSGYIKASYAETQTFTVTSDDGCRLYINNTLVIDDFYSETGVYEGSWTFGEPDMLYPIALEYRENTDNAHIKFEVQSVSGFPSKSTVPTSDLFSGASPLNNSPITITVT